MVNLKTRFTFMLLLALVWAATNATSGALHMQDQAINTDQLGGATRYLAYVSTDKPIYREGEPVYIRVTVLNATDNTPIPMDGGHIGLKIKGPKGETLFDGDSQIENSSGGLKWEIPMGTAGGEYTAEVISSDQGTPKATRTFDIRAYRAPRLKTQIEFTREGYGPGDLVQATVDVKRAEGGIPVGASVTVIARVDGSEVFQQAGFKVGSNGLCYAEFRLPETIETGDGNLAFVIEDGGVIETASKTLPILLQNLDITFYPEGGELVAGLANRVYVQALRPDGKPADIRGFIVHQQNGRSEAVAGVSVATEHEGRGLFSFTPNTSGTYALKLTSPSGITREFPLPEVAVKGVTLQATQTLYGFDDEISFKVQASDQQNLVLTLHKREQSLDSRSFTITKEMNQPITLQGKDAEGVLIATLWSASGKPLAERLIYRQPKFAVHIDIKASKQRYVPGEKVTLDVTTTDENGRPVEAVVGLTVTDDAVLEMIEKREQAPNLPVMVYLENEVMDLADAQVYLDPNNPESPNAVDLLLGTQGWRRFVLVNYPALKNQYADAIKRIMAENSPHIAAVGLMRNRGQVLPMAAAPRPEAVVDMLAEEQELAGLEALADEEVIAADDNGPEIKKDQGAKPVQKIAAAAKEKVARLFEKRAMDEDLFDGRQWNNVYIREYAHPVRANRQANDRRDFTETLYWNAGIKTSARSGQAQISFDLSDSVTSFKVAADAFGRNGALGSADQKIESVEPFYIEPKMPLSITVGDVLELPIALVNGTANSLSDATLIARGEGLRIEQAQPIHLAPDQRARQLLRIQVDQPGTYELNINAAAGPFSDSVTRSLKVLPKGFPISINQGGLLSADHRFSTRIEIPKQVEPGSLRTEIKVYPSPLASMEEALNALLREPYGCFEQTSSTTYPLVMAQQYFLTHQGIPPEKISKAKDLLEKGYARLIGFESPDQGYEWFGANPAHEALTAYGLMEFHDLSKVMNVDQAMIERTRNWLLSRRDGEGNFKLDSKALDSFGRAPVPTTNAYIVWSLLESGESPSKLSKEIAAVKAEALSTKDTYIIALGANILYLAQDPDAQKLAAKLRDAAAKNGSISQAETSITRSGGDALTIETTSLAILAWLKDDEHWAAEVEESIKWLFERSKSGRFGSTQSTVLALKAINAYDSARAKPKAPGSVQLVIDGQDFGKPVHFDENSKGAIALPDFAAKLGSGQHELELRMVDGSKMPFALTVNYHTSLPPSEQSNVTLSTQLSHNQVKEGESLELNLKLMVGDTDAPTPMAILGVPAGLEVRHDQLKELVGAERISAYEVIGQDVVLYWRALKANTELSLPISLTAAIPGSYTGPASRSYLYYTDEVKHWAEGVQVQVLSR